MQHEDISGGKSVTLTAMFSLSQWPTFKLLGITYLVGKIEFKLLFHCPLAG